MRLSGPTNFSPILKNMISNVNPKNLFEYQILFMITDGLITDMDQTVDCIVKCSELPVSIVIVGVGDADFEKMQTLDNDDGKLRDSKGRKPTRDCVQFVEFNNCKKDIHQLRKQVLMEIPKQIEKY